jgi:hypothetical protein
VLEIQADAAARVRGVQVFQPDLISFAEFAREVQAEPRAAVLGREKGSKMCATLSGTAALVDPSSCASPLAGSVRSTSRNEATPLARRL